MEQADEEEGEKLHSVDFKQEAVRRMAQATTILVWPKSWAFDGSCSTSWRDQFREGGRAGLERRRRPDRREVKSEIVSPPSPSAAELRIAELRMAARP